MSDTADMPPEEQSDLARAVSDGLPTSLPTSVDDFQNSVHENQATGDAQTLDPASKDSDSAPWKCSTSEQWEAIWPKMRDVNDAIKEKRRLIFEREAHNQIVGGRIQLLVKTQRCRPPAATRVLARYEEHLSETSKLELRGEESKGGTWKAREDIDTEREHAYCHSALPGMLHSTR